MRAFNSFVSLLCFAFLITIGWSEDKCEKHISEQCLTPSNFFDNFPENSDGFSKICSEYISFLKCLIDYEESCKDTVYMPPILAGRRTLKKFCDNETDLFNAVVDNSQCFKDVYVSMKDGNQDKCVQKKKNENLELYEEVSALNDFNETAVCLIDLMEVSCVFEAIFGKCEDKAKELALQIVKEYGLYSSICENRIEESKDFMKALSLNLDPECSLEEFIYLLKNGAEMNNTK